MADEKMNMGPEENKTPENQLWIYTYNRTGPILYLTKRRSKKK